MKHTIPSLSRAPARCYRPLLERLEERLPPGDAVVGNWLSMSWLLEAHRPTVPVYGTTEATHTEDLAIVQTTTPAEDGLSLAAPSWDSLGTAEHFAALTLDSSAREGSTVPLTFGFTDGEFATRRPAARRTFAADPATSAGAGASVREAQLTGPVAPRLLPPSESGVLTNSVAEQTAALATILNNGGPDAPPDQGGGPQITDLGTAPDATDRGGMATTSSEYRFPASVDADILGDRMTEIWARVYRPTDLSSGPHPLLLFLHGNHATCGAGSNPRVDTTCEYTTTGTCPAARPIVVPNHLGYGYTADQLASHGYIVVSINANRGITCGGGVAGDNGLNLARGRLILKHMQRLSDWNRVGGAPTTICGTTNCLVGRLDFDQVGIMGHSRGGEGARAAYTQYLDAGSPWPARIVSPVNFRGIFEIGAVDGQTSRVLDARGTAWTQLLPMCDGDVSDLQGVRPFDRMIRNDPNENLLSMKATYTVWGANHNFYNSEWQQSDPGTCQGPGNPVLPRQTTGSAAQRTTGLASMMAFFRGNVGWSADPAYNKNFNPLYTPPAVVTDITRVDRGFVETIDQGWVFPLDDFRGATGTNMWGVPNEAGNLTQYVHGAVPRHAPAQRAALVSWNAGADRYLQSNWQWSGFGVDMSGGTGATLDLRLSRQSSALNPTGPTNFHIQLVGADDSLSNPIRLDAWSDLRGPVGGTRTGLHPILQTVRIPLTEFSPAVVSQIRGVRLTFNDTASGAIYVGGISFSWYNSGEWVGNMPFGGNSGGMPTGEIVTEEPEAAPSNTVVSLSSVSTNVNGAWQTGYEIELNSSRAFPVRNEMAILRVGDREFSLSRYPQCGETNTLIFTLTPEEYAGLQQGAPMVVQYGQAARSSEQWHFGGLDRTILNK